MAITEKHPIAMNSVDLIPLQEIGVSFGSRRTSAGSFIVGHVENRSERAFACVRVTFQLTNSLGGERREAGTIEFEVRNLRSREERPYEERVPEEVGYYLKAKQECS